MNPEILVARLLGPEGPELTCEQCFETLDAYVELALAAGAASADARHPGMAAHLVGCPACAEDRESLDACLDRDGG
jgi:hypothetical protein